MQEQIATLKDKDLPNYIIGLIRHRDSLLRMPDLIVSCALSLLLFPWWLSTDWPDLLLSVLPNILGFTIGSFAIFLGVGSDNFRRAILGRSEQKSPYLRLSGLFVFSIAIQLFGIMLAIIAKGFYKINTPSLLAGGTFDILQVLGSFFSVLVFCWGLAITLRVAIRIFRVTRWYYVHLLTTPEAQSPSCPCNNQSPLAAPPTDETAQRASGADPHSGA